MYAKIGPREKARQSIPGLLSLYSQIFFHEQGHELINPLMWGKSVDPLGPDPGSSIEFIQDLDYQGQRFYNISSMILHKQKLMRDGWGKIAIISPNTRLEKSYRKDTKRHLWEFVQADFEVEYATQDDIFKLVEKYFAGLHDFLEDKAKDKFDTLGVEIFRFAPKFEQYMVPALEAEHGPDWEDIMSRGQKQPFWAKSHKREFYDKGPDENGIYANYDLILPLGFGEVLSGAEREHDYDTIVSKILADSKEETGLPLERFKDYLELAKKTPESEGLIPSAGGGIGIERLARFLTRSEHVGDVQPFRRVPGEIALL